MEVQVNWLGVAAAALSSMVVGFVWYAKPLFGTRWAALAKLSEKQMAEGAWKAIATALVAALFTAYILAHLTYLAHYFFQHTYMQDALSTAFWVWLGISTTTLVTHYAFERRPSVLTMLAVGNQLVTFLAMGAIIGWLHP